VQRIGAHNVGMSEARNSSQSAVWMAGLALLPLLALFGVLSHWSGIGHLANDAAQQVSAARALRDGQGLVVTTAYYDLQLDRSLPVPLTVWPPGLAVVSAALAAVLGVDPANVLAGINIAAWLLCGVLIFQLARAMGATVGVALSFAWLLWANAEGLRITLAGGTDVLHATLLVAFLCVLHGGLRRGALTVSRLVAAALCLAAAALVRYQTIALIPALFAALWMTHADRAETLRQWMGRCVLLVLPMSLVVAGLLLRNLHVVGSLTGGPQPAHGYGLATLLQQVKSCVQRLLGAESISPVLVGLVAMAAVAIGATCWLQRRAASAERFASVAATPDVLIASRRAVLWLALATVICTAGLVLAVSTRSTAYGFEARYLFCAVPLGIVAAAACAPDALLRLKLRRGPVAFAPMLLVFAALLAMQLRQSWAQRDWLMQGGTTAHIVQWLKQPVADGQTLRQFLRATSSLEHPVLSNQSQLLALTASVPTLGVPEPRVSARAWRDADILALVRRHGVRQVLVFPQLPLAAGGDAPGDRVLALVRREPLPGWLMPLVMTESVALYAVRE
jgi:hypothetical protein